MSTVDWFLSASERGNKASDLPLWCEGNLVVPRVHGTAYFDRLVTAVQGLGAGDHLFFTDWRGDPDELMRANGPTIGELFCGAARRGVIVKGLMWRSHSDKMSYSEEENRHLGQEIQAAGGEALLDERVRRFGSHHQKLVVLRYLGRSARDVAFAGGIDLCHGRRDDADHHGDPQPPPMSKKYGSRPPWHDVQLEIHGPVVGSLDTTFRERWFDPTSLDSHDPVAWVKDKLAKANMTADPLPDQPADPPACGPHAVQVRRTYPSIRPGYRFAPKGERSVARGYEKAVRRAGRLIYLEDQYMWSTQVAKLFADALRANRELHLVVIVPRYPDVDGRLALPNQVGRAQAIAMCNAAGRGRVHVFDVENHEGTPVYVHAKVCVVDDIWAGVGSDNFNRRSWTHDSELSCSILDSTVDERQPTDPNGNGDLARTFARDLRLALLREHLDRAKDGSQDSDLLHPESAVRRHPCCCRRTRGVAPGWQGWAAPAGTAPAAPAGEAEHANAYMGSADLPAGLRPGWALVAGQVAPPLVSRARTSVAAVGRPAGEQISQRALNRAYLERQLLLGRSDLSPEQAIEHLVGMQAQSPLAPYVGLWTRLRDFATDDLASLLEQRQAVRGTSLRKTLHLHTARDYLRVRSLMQGVLDAEAKRNSTFGKDLVEGLDLGSVMAVGKQLVEQRPRTGTELRELLGKQWPDRDPFALWHVVVCAVPLVQVPPRGLWGRGGAVTLTTVEAWLGRSLDKRVDVGSLLLGYLAAFGPASAADIRTWSGLPGIRAVVERMRPELRIFTDARGRELFDIPDGRLPEPDAVAAPRFLPEFDNAMLSHDDRSRIVPEHLQVRVHRSLGKPMLVVDGAVAATWRLVRNRSTRAVLEISPFEALPVEETQAVLREGEALIAFAAADSTDRDIRILT